MSLWCGVQAWKMDMNVGMVYLKHNLLVKCLERSSKVLFRLNFLVVMTSIVVHDTQMQNIKSKYSKLITQSDAQKQMVGCVNFMTLNILKLVFFHVPWIHYILEEITTKPCK